MWKTMGVRPAISSALGLAAESFPLWVYNSLPFGHGQEIGIVLIIIIITMTQELLRIAGAERKNESDVGGRSEAIKSCPGQ